MTTNEMITIDGSKGEGGGQILRTAVALGAVTKNPVKIINIRAKRAKPGLRPQHLSAIRAVADLCSAGLKGAVFGSPEIEFSPGKIKGGKLNIDIGTAGSITLVLQALMIPAMFAENTVNINIRGGTDVRWSPQVDYLRLVTLPVLKKFGYNAKIELVRRGYYPAGGGRVIVTIEPVEKLKSLDLKERGRIISTGGISHAHLALKKADVARRQVRVARSSIFNKLSGISDSCKIGSMPEIKIEQDYWDALSYGSGITLFLRTENSVIGTDSLGERGKPAEVVGRDASTDLIREIESNAPLDRYMADQIVPYLALAGGSVRVSEITEHTRTNVDIVNKFGFNLKIRENSIYSGNSNAL